MWGMAAGLEQDNKDARHVKTYEVQMKEKDFGEGPWLQNNLDNGAGLLIPVPLPLGGAIIIGEQTIVYYNGSVFKAIPIRPVHILDLTLPMCHNFFAYTG
jgi:DNA damage-binding protein 1